MSRRQLFARMAIGLATIGLAWTGVRQGAGFRKARPDPDDEEEGSSFDRVLLVCRGVATGFSPGVYLHGWTGGGPACLPFVAKAAPGMRIGEAGDSAGGLCGYFFEVLGPRVTSGGGLSLREAPKPDGSGVVDWQQYCGYNVDLILIDVDRRTAECYVSPEGREASSKSLVGRLDDLKFGG